MLTPDAAQKSLAEHQIKNPENQWRERIKTLPADSILDKVRHLFKRLSSGDDSPPSLRSIAYALIGRKADGVLASNFSGHPDPAYWDRHFAALEALDPTSRIQIFECFFPKIAAHIETWWQYAPQLPFTIGYQRMAFRAPNHPEVYSTARASVLQQLIHKAGNYEQDLMWFAQYAAYINHGYSGELLGKVFAAVIAAGSETGDTLFNLLMASARGEHEIGTMGRHVSRALLSSNRSEGWEFMEKMLLAAQRQEGLRQVILETVDEAHPKAFVRMLRLILDQELARFSAVTRALDVWLGYQLNSEQVRLVNQALGKVLLYLENPDARSQALTSGNGEQAYLALWATAYEDTFVAIPLAAELLNDADAERRFAGVNLLFHVNLPESRSATIPALDDADLRVTGRALQVIAGQSGYTKTDELQRMPDLFERLERNLPRFGKQRELPPIIWEWMVISIHPYSIARLMVKALGDRSPKRLMPHFPMFDVYTKLEAAKKLAKLTPWDDDIRDCIFKLVGDRNSWTRNEAIRLLKGRVIRENEAIYLESLLTRKASDLRRAVITLLCQQEEDAAFASAERLLNARKADLRPAGVEMLTILQQAKTDKPEAQTRLQTLARSYQDAHADIPQAQLSMLNQVLEVQAEQPTLQNALGLMNPTDRTPVTPPVKRDIQMPSLAASKTLHALDEWIHENREMPLDLPTWRGEQEVILGNLNNAMPIPNPQKSLEEDLPRLILHDYWEVWWQNRPSEQHDADGLELVRALFDLSGRYNGFYYTSPTGGRPKRVQLRYGVVVERVLIWLIRLHPPAGMTNFVLDVVETKLAEVSSSLLKKIEGEPQRSQEWRGSYDSEYTRLFELTRNLRALLGDWEPRHHIRMWQLVHWYDQPTPKAHRHHPPLDELIAAYDAGAANEDDLIDQLLGPRSGYYGRHGFPELTQLSTKKPNPLLKQYPVLAVAFERCRKRILEIELSRGEMPTPATDAAFALRSVYGIDTFIRILQWLGKDSVARGYHYHNQGRVVTMSHLLQISFPAEGETAEQFVKKIKSAKIPQKLLIEAAVYAPQWANYVEAALDWAYLAEAVWWTHAHTKDRSWHVEEGIRESWRSQTGERTPLTSEDLLNGAVDVAWFWRVYNGLGAERWKKVYDAAKFASGGTGHSRAKLFADAMLGKLDESELNTRILKKRHQDSARALGLLPLPQKGRDAIILKRYKLYQEFLRTSRQFGAQRRENEKRATETGMENLARTAGYADPVRLQWAMELEEVADLRSGEVMASVDDVTVTLRLDEMGKPLITIARAGRKLKSVPAKYKKTPEIVALRERKTAIDRQYSRMRLSLENAMCRRDTFTAKELKDLLGHPVLAPMLQQLIFAGEKRLGYLTDDGLALQSHTGKVTPVSSETHLRIAHPYDLYQSNEWSLWQRECFLAERIQPFKQVFRELYVLTEAERADGAISNRYTGHQVQPRQAMALLGQRGWITQIYDYNGANKTSHQEKISVTLAFDYGYFTPAEVEGLTIAGVTFHKAGEWLPIMLDQVPPIMFSEVMRDLDLVVSVAHRGGVDPEATASTVEMRSALLRETCTLLKTDNVELNSSHALIQGKLGSYSVHLGSAIVHRQPGGALCIIPVHAQHRGRLFLPFADDDPRTAEVISKVLLLAKDHEIKDPSILEQIFARGIVLP